VKDFAKKAMKTTEVRVDVKLNKFLWSKGIRNVRARDEASPPAAEARR
jgi:large subunit ribosomal protein L31e